MKKTRRQVFAVMLAAVMAFTSPGTSFYAVAENRTAAEDSIKGGNVTSPEEDGSRVGEAGTETDGSMAGEPEREDGIAGEAEAETDENMAGEPGTEESTAAESGTGKTTANEPETGESTANGPGTEEDTADGPGTGESMANGLGTEEGTADGPGTGEGTVDGPGTGESTADGSGTGENTADGLGTEEGKANVPGAEDADSEDTGLCAHHQEHTEDCGYKLAAGDEEGSPCAFECRICRMEKLLLALPEEVSEDNADEVRTQLEEILVLYTELTEEEQEQADISHCLELQAALDILGGQNHAGKPALIAEAVSYQDCNTNGQNWETKTCTDYTAVTSETPVADWSDGWYVVNGEVTIESRIKVSGTVHLILMNGCVLNARKGVSVNEGNSLTIYAQPDGDNMGILTTADTGIWCAGIGGDDGRTSGTVTINGGSITATGGSFAAGIGGGDGGGGGTITINGGTVSAAGNSSGSAIGDGYRGSGGNTVIIGGTVNGTTYHAVTFDVNGMEGVQIPVQGIVKGKKATAPGEIDGYIIDGWYTNKECTTQFNFDTPIDSDIILYAKCKKNTDYIANVTIDGNTAAYTTISGAWRAVQGRTAALTILKDLSLTANLEITDEATDVTIEAAEGAVIHSTTDFFIVRRGKLTLKSGIFESSGGGKSGIYMTDGKVEMTGGSIKMTGSGAVKGIEISGSGTLCISGGTLETASKDGAALLVSELKSGGTVSLTGGTLINENPQGKAVKINNEKIKDGKITDLLGESYAFYKGDTLITDAVTKDSLGAGTYSVKECSTHTYSWVWDESGTHYQLCSACGHETEHQEHTVGEDGTCSVCGAAYVACVETGGETTNYYSLGNAWKALAGKTGTITLLRDVTATETLTVSSGMNVTLEMADNVTFQNNVNDCFKVDGGSLTLAGGKVVEKGSGKSIVYAASGTLCMTGGIYESVENGLWVDKNVTVRLSGGTIQASGKTLRYESTPIMDMLDKSQDETYFAFYDEDGNLITSGLDNFTLSGSCSVNICTHKDVPQQGNQDKHFKRCSACGRETEFESHTFDGENTCTVCGAKRVACVETDGMEAADYVSLEGAWTALEGRKGTITLLQDVTTTNTLTVSSGMDVTFKMADGVTFENTTNDCFKVDGGTLTLADGKVVLGASNRPSIVYAASGTLCMTGGTYESNANGLYVESGVTVRLSGGTVKASGTVFRYVSHKVMDMLDQSREGKHFAFYVSSDGSEKLIDSGLDREKLVSGTYTVNECTHAYKLQQGNQDMHYDFCPACGDQKNEEPHTYKDGICEGCKAEIQASVTVGEQTSYYPTIAGAWAAVQGKTATLTILKNLSLTDKMEMNNGATNLTVEAAEDVKVNSNTDFFIINDGKLALKSGNYESSGAGKSGIYMTDGTVEMSGGSIKMTGSDKTKGIQINGSGTLHISGGTLEVSGNSSGHALLVTKGTVQLTGGVLKNDTGNALRVEESGKTIRNLLEAGYCVYGSDGKPVTDGVDGKVLASGTYTVKECASHTYETHYDQKTHFQRCTICGMETEHNPHSYGEGGACEGCGMTCVASVDIGGEITGYESFDAAWSALSGKTGTIKLWEDVETTKNFTVTPGMDVTLEMAESITFKNTAQDCFQVKGGTLTLSGGTVVEEKSGKSIVYAASGCLNVTGGTYQSSGNGLWVDSGAEVQLSGGKLIIPNGTALRYQSPRIVREMMKQPQGDRHFALYYDDGNYENGSLVTEGMEGETLPSGTYTVDECRHGYVQKYDEDTHYQFCPACGDETEHEMHTFEGNHCTGCGLDRVVSVVIDGKTTYYESFDVAWDALRGKTGTIKLWENVDTANSYWVDANVDVTLEMAEGVTFKSTANDCFRIGGGTLTLAGGTVTKEQSGGYIVRAESGRLNITAGTYQSSGDGLWANSSVEVQLSGGKLIVPDGTALRYQSPRMVREMLKQSQENQYFAFYDANGKLVTEGMEKDRLPSGTYTIGKCTHDYKQRYDKETHYQFCPACSSEKDREQHTFGSDGLCTVCSAGNIIRVEADGATTDYILLDEAWDAVRGKTATLTFLKSLSLEKSMTITDGATDLTVKAAEGVTVSSTSDFFIVRNGKLSISSGAYESRGNGKSGIYMTGGSVEMTGGSIKMTGAGETKAIHIDGGKLAISGGTLEVSGNEAGVALLVSDGTVSLSGGTLIGGKGKAADTESAWWIYIRDLLAEGYAIYDSDNNLLTEEQFDGRMLESGPYTVKLCRHNYVGEYEDEGYHYQCCSICGVKGELEPHVFQDGYCICGYPCAASVEIEGVSTDYGTLEAAWAALKGKKGTITLRRHVETDQTLVVDAGMDVTVEMDEEVYDEEEDVWNEGGSLYSLARECFRVNGGTLTLTSGEVVSDTEESEAGESWIVNVLSGVFRVTGGTYVSEGGNGFYADSGASVQLSGGTFIILGYSEKSVALEYGAPHVVREMLAPAQEGKCFVLSCRYSESEEGEESGEGIVPDSLLGQESLKAGVYSVMPVTVALDSTEELVYDGSEKEPEVTVSLWDEYFGESIELTAGTDYEVSYSNNINAGDDAVITVTGKTFNGNLTQKFTIEKAVPAIGAVTAEIPANTLDVSRVVLNRENGSIAGTLELAEDTELKYGSNLRTWKFTPETPKDDEPQNYKEITGEVEIIAADTIAPTASYRIDEDGWKKFINTVSFGLFCKDYKKVTISGTDDTDEVTGSGIAGIQYFISDKWIPDEEIVKTGDLEWSNYNYNEEEEISLDGAGTYFIYVKVSDQAGNKAVYNSEGIVIYRESELSPSDLTYTYRQEQDCTVQLAMNGNTFKALTDTDGNIISADCYTIDSNGALTLKGTYLDTLSQGAHIYQVIMNPQGVETDKAALEYAFTVRKKPAELMVTTAAAAGRPYDGTNTVEITAVTLSGIVPGDDVSVSLKGVRGELSGVNAGTYDSVTLPELALTGEARSNYTLVQPKEAVPASVVIGKAETGSAAENTLHRSYLYSRENADRISLTGLLPRDCGTVSCSEPVISGNVAYSSEPDVNDGTLSYTLKNGNADDEGTITVTLTTQNYEDITITVIVKLSSLIPVRLKEGTEVTLERDTLVYGEAFSELVFKEAEFVDIDGNTVEGTLAWKDAALKPGVGTISNIWIFTPSDTAYASAEGMMMITVKKAVPVVSAVPSVADRVYNPSRALADSDLSGGQAAGVDGNTLEGTWSWEKADIVPTVDNHGYTAIFTPADANLANYETAAAAVPVTVAKAVPYIAKLPFAGGITYGDTLGASSLSGGIAQYGNGAGLAGDGSGSTERVEGTFMWKDTALKPVAADSGVTGYRIVFTPSDTVNYETAECEVTLEVKKADSAPNMPDSAMKVPEKCERVSSVELPEGWEWQEADREKALEIGKAVNAVAVYTGADSGNYEKETVIVAITRAVCSHANTEIRNAKEAACQEKGYTGDTWCLDCGIKLETGTAIPALGHDYTSEVTKEPTEDSEGIRTYTCTRCGDSYTESIDKLDPSHPGSTSEPGTTTNPDNTSEPGTTPNPDNTPNPSSTPDSGTTPNPGGTPDPGTTPNPGSTPEPGATLEPPIPSTTPEPGKPFIKGADGKTGWDVIRAEEETAEEGSAIHVDMNGTAVVPGDIFDSIRGRDITVTFDMGDGILWSVDGKKILTEQAGDIDFSVKTGTDTIPVDIVNNVTGERYSIQLSLAHNGEFGFTAVLSIQLGKENAGLTASLYYYNRSTGELEYVCADKVAEDGSASLAFTHASDYVVVIGESREEESGNTEPAQPGSGQAPAGADGNADAKESPRTGQERKTEWPVVAGILTFVVAGIAILLVRRKKERGE